MSDGSDKWRLNVIKREIPIFNSIDKDMHWFISRFTPITKSARLTSMWIAKLIIGDSIISQKKELLTKILYNYKAILGLDFTEMRKVKKEVALP